MFQITDKLLEIDNKLNESPNGFDLDDFYSCVICSKIVSSGKGWYDKLGPKCLLCQKATKEGIIPDQACLQRTSWLAMWELNLLGLHHRVIRMMMKRKWLKPRIILNSKGENYFYIFIKSENPVLLKRFFANKVKPNNNDII